MPYEYQQPHGAWGNDAADFPGPPEELGAKLEEAIAKARLSGEDEGAWPTPGDPFARGTPAAFPSNILPVDFVAHVADMSDRMGADHGMLAMFALSSVAAAIHDGIKIQPKASDPSWRESARVWIAAVGEPSIKKSPAHKAMAIPLTQQDADWREQERSALSRRNIEERVYNKRLSKHIIALANDEPSDEPEPLQPLTVHRAIVEDITIEGLRDVLADTSRGTLAMLDELSALFGSMDAYRERGVSKDRPAYLKLYDGGAHRVDRAGNKSTFVSNWGLSVVGGIQPEAIRAVAGKLQDDGLLQRFNVVLAEPARQGHDRARDTDAFDRYRSIVRGLFQIQPSERVVRFGSDAQSVFVEFSSFVNTAQQVQAFPPKMRTHIGKWEGQFARYALMLHCIKCLANKAYPEAVPVSGETAEAVRRLFMEYLLPHAQVFYDGILSDTDDIPTARWIAGHILSKGLTEIDRRTIKRAYKAMRHASDWDVHRTMAVLETFGWVEAETVVVPHAKWRINPAVHHVFKEKACQEKARRERERELIRLATAGGS